MKTLFFPNIWDTHQLFSESKNDEIEQTRFPKHWKGSESSLQRESGLFCSRNVIIILFTAIRSDERNK